jgi:dihydropteroate synthase
MHARPLYQWRCRERTITVGERTLIMGILNVTPDSFSDGGRFHDVNDAVRHVLQMEADGADIIDIGGESTRPGAQPVDEKEELARVIPVIAACAPKVRIPVSVDTYKSTVAKQAIEAGAVIVNDISGLRYDPRLAPLVATTGAGIVLMHIRGTPRNMQQDPQYNNLLEDIRLYLQQSREMAVNAGVAGESIVIDPGIGFGKRTEHNFQIIQELASLAALNCPILVGPSRKSFIGNTLKLPVDQRVEGTAAAVTACILNGAHIVRVHDVKEMKRVAVIADAIRGK